MTNFSDDDIQAIHQARQGLQRAGIICRGPSRGAASPLRDDFPALRQFVDPDPMTILRARMFYLQRAYDHGTPEVRRQIHHYCQNLAHRRLILPENAVPHLLGISTTTLKRWKQPGHFRTIELDLVTYYETEQMSDLAVTLSYLTASQAANLLGIAPQTLRIWAYRGQVAARRLPLGELRFSPQSIDNYISRSRQLLPTRVAAAILGIDPDTLTLFWRPRGIIKGILINNRYYYQTIEVHALKQQIQNTPINPGFEWLDTFLRHFPGWQSTWVTNTARQLRTAVSNVRDWIGYSLLPAYNRAPTGLRVTHYELPALYINSLQTYAAHRPFTHSLLLDYRQECEAAGFIVTAPAA